MRGSRVRWPDRRSGGGPRRNRAAGLLPGAVVLVAALTALDACVRLLPGVMGASESLGEESFALSSDFAGLLEYPHYTKPPVWKGKAVPDVLLSGNHAKIRGWRLEEAKNTTQQRRPDLWAKVKG